MAALAPASSQSYYDAIQDIYDLEQAEDAIAALRTLAVEAQADNLPDTVAVIQIELASYFFHYSISFDSAIYYCDAALSSIQENIEGYKIPYLRAWYNKGYYYRKWDKFDEAKEALDIILDEPFNKYTFRATNQMGKLYKDRSEFALAFKYYEEGLKLAGNDAKRKIQVYEYISFAYMVMETDEGARNAIYWLEKLEDAVNALSDDDYADYLPLAAYNMGDCYYQLGDLDKAIELVAKADKLLDICCDDPDFKGLIADFEGLMEHEKGNYAEAIYKYKEGLSLFEYSYDLGRGQGRAGSYRSLAEAYRDWGKLDSALHYANKTIVDRIFGFDNNLKTKTSPSLEDFLENGEKSYLIDDLMFKGDIYEKMHARQGGSLDSAVRYYELAESVLDAMTYEHVEAETKIFWRQTAKNVYYHLIRLYLIQGRTDLAFIFSEKSKYVILEEHLRKSNLRQHYSETLLIEYFTLMDSLQSAEIYNENQKLQSFSQEDEHYSLVSLRNREAALLTQIKNQHPFIFNELFRWQRPDIQLIQRELKLSESVLLEYFIHDSMSYVFLLDGQKIVAKSLSPRAEIADAVVGFLAHVDPKVIGEADAASYDEKALLLFDLLIDRASIAEATEIVIVPDDVLTLLPFQVLVHEKSIRPLSFIELQYLLTWKPIRYLINGRSIYDQHSNRVETSNDVVSFVPDFEENMSYSMNKQDQVMRDELTPLAGATKEAKVLCELFPCREVAVPLGEQAFYREVKQRSKIIHVATHARMNDSIPSHSHLIMESTSESDEDDLIHIFELKNKSIQSDLVVLSACNTGAGKIHRGEGLASLGIAFYYAGSPNLITSLWSIPDHASSFIMQQFYTNLSQGMVKYQALRQAKLNYLKDTSFESKHPFFWGGFIFYGDDLPLDIVHPANSLPWTMLVFLATGIVLLLYVLRRIRPS